MTRTIYEPKGPIKIALPGYVPSSLTKKTIVLASMDTGLMDVRSFKEVARQEVKAR